jgi:hypothetical protein
MHDAPVSLVTLVSEPCVGLRCHVVVGIVLQAPSKTASILYLSDSHQGPLFMQCSRSRKMLISARRLLRHVRNARAVKWQLKIEMTFLEHYSV